MLKCEKCGLSTTNARAFFQLLNPKGVYSWYCKTCVRGQIRTWNLPSDLTNLDDPELRRAMESINAMIHNAIFNDKKHLKTVQAHAQEVLRREG